MAISESNCSGCEHFRGNGRWCAFDGICVYMVRDQGVPVKSNRRKRGHWGEAFRRVVVMDGVVTDVRQPLSADTSTPVEVAFERRLTS